MRQFSNILTQIRPTPSMYMLVEPLSKSRLFINLMCPCKSLSTFGQCCPCPLNRGTGTVKPYQNRDRDRSYGTAVPIHIAKVVPRTCPKGKTSGKMVNCWGARPANPMPNIGNSSVYNFHSRFTRNTIRWARSGFRSVVRMLRPLACSSRPRDN